MRQEIFKPQLSKEALSLLKIMMHGLEPKKSIKDKNHPSTIDILIEKEKARFQKTGYYTALGLAFSKIMTNPLTSKYFNVSFHQELPEIDRFLSFSTVSIISPLSLKGLRLKTYFPIDQDWTVFNTIRALSHIFNTVSTIDESDYKALDFNKQKWLDTWISSLMFPSKFDDIKLILL